MKDNFNNLRKHLIRFLERDTRVKSDAVKFEGIVAENYSGVKKNHESQGKKMSSEYKLKIKEIHIQTQK